MILIEIFCGKSKVENFESRNKSVIFAGGHQKWCSPIFVPKWN